MPARALVVAPVLMSVATFLPAQLGAGPGLGSPPVMNPTIGPPGAALVNDVTIQTLGGADRFVAYSYRTTLNGPDRLGSSVYNTVSNVQTPTTDLGAITAPLQDLSISRDGLQLMGFVNGVGNRVYRRTSTAVPFPDLGLPIQNLPGDAYRLEFGAGASGDVIFGCRVPNARITRFDYDAQQVAVANGVDLLPPLGSPANIFDCVIPLDDPGGTTKMLLVAEGPTFAFDQHLFCVEGIEPTSPSSHWYSMPQGNFLGGAAQLEGGRIVGAVNRINPTAPFPVGILELNGVFTPEAGVPAAGGQLELAVFGPPGGFAALLIATREAGPIGFVGVQNVLGVPPAEILLTMPIRRMLDGVAEWTLQTSPTSSFVLEQQGVSLDATVTLGNTAHLRFF